MLRFKIPCCPWVALDLIRISALVSVALNVLSGKYMQTSSLSLISRAQPHSTVPCGWRLRFGSSPSDSCCSYRSAPCFLISCWEGFTLSLVPISAPQTLSLSGGPFSVPRSCFPAQISIFVCMISVSYSLSFFSHL